MKPTEKLSRNRLLLLVIMMVACWEMVFGQQVPISLPSLSAAPGASVNIPVNVGSLTGLSVTAFEFVVVCDTSLMTFDGVVDNGTLATGLGPLINNSVNGFGPGRMKVVCAATLPLSGSGVLIYLKATIRNRSGSSAVRFEPNTLFLNATEQSSYTNGSIRVNRRPQLTPVSAKTVAQGDSLFFTSEATDLDLPSDTLTFSLTNAPAGAKINATTGAFGWRPSYSQVGPFSVLVKVTDTGGMADSSAVSITVSKTNIKPTLLNKMRDTTIIQGQTLNFTYSATDPNGDPLTFVLLSPPAGATVTNAGVFTWRPVYPTTGTSTIQVVVSDGLLQDVATATVTVSRVNQKPSISARTPAAVTQISQNKSTMFSVSAKDPNGDPLVYRWVVNNLVVKSGTDTSYTVSFTDPHNSAKIVTGVVTDPDGLADSTMWFFTITDVQNQNSVPTDYVLGQNYPNPFNPTTTIQFEMPKSSPVTLEVFNVAGMRVRALLRGETISAGSHSVMWDARDQSGKLVPSGVYIYRVNAGDFHAWKKMTLLK